VHSKKFTILVTGTSAITGYGVVESLRSCKYDCKIIGIAIYEDAIGKQWCDVFETGVFALSEQFPKFIYDMIIKYDVDLVIPCVELEVNALTKNRALFDRLDVKFVLNNPDVYAQLNDKSKTHGFLKNKVEQIPTLIGSSESAYGDVSEKLGIPFILKKNISSGSKGVVTINDARDFDYWKYKFSDGYICQKKIVGDEYTIAVFGTGDGQYVNMIAFWRRLGNGTTLQAQCIAADDEMIDYVNRICTVIRPLGPTNIQLIKDGSKYLLLEVNARISASTSLRTKFGVNEAEMCIEYFLLHKIPEKRKQKRGSAIRYLKDDIHYDSDHF
jgi:carbamoyl-phosphate synthase large subunit